MTEFNWTPWAISELTRMWAEGLTGGEIGKRLGISKSAAVAKAHRLNLPGRASPIRRLTPQERKLRDEQAEMRRTRLHQPKRAYDSAPKLESRATRPTTNPAKVEYYRGMGLSGSSCQWPLGEPRTEEFHFCGADAVNGKPYCPEHCADAYVIVRVNGRPTQLEQAPIPETDQAA
jgi:GcrA cell cycle regulator